MQSNTAVMQKRWWRLVFRKVTFIAGMLYWTVLPLIRCQLMSVFSWVIHSGGEGGIKWITVSTLTFIGRLKKCMHLTRVVSVLVYMFTWWHNSNPHPPKKNCQGAPRVSQKHPKKENGEESQTAGSKTSNFKSKTWAHFGFYTHPGKAEPDMTKAVCNSHGQLSQRGDTSNMSARFDHHSTEPKWGKPQPDGSRDLLACGLHCFLERWLII